MNKDAVRTFVDALHRIPVQGPPYYIISTIDITNSLNSNSLQKSLSKEMEVTRFVKLSEIIENKIKDFGTEKCIVVIYNDIKAKQEYIEKHVKCIGIIATNFHNIRTAIAALYHIFFAFPYDAKSKESICRYIDYLMEDEKDFNNFIVDDRYLLILNQCTSSLVAKLKMIFRKRIQILEIGSLPNTLNPDANIFVITSFNNWNAIRLTHSMYKIQKTFQINKNNIFVYSTDDLIDESKFLNHITDVFNEDIIVVQNKKEVNISTNKNYIESKISNYDAIEHFYRIMKQYTLKCLSDQNQKEPSRQDLEKFISEEIYKLIRDNKINMNEFIDILKFAFKAFK